MLPILSKELNFSNINVDLSHKQIGKKFKIDNCSQYSFNDHDLYRYKTIEKLEYNSLFNKGSKILDQINFSGNDDFYDLVPEIYLAQSKKDLARLLRQNISDYYFKVLPKRYLLTSKILDAKYDHAETITGRMKIVEGVNYLTMKKQSRNNIEISKNNFLVEVDIKSCEPALLHTILYGTPPEDVYNHFGKDIPRNKVKLAVISSIYGSSIQKVKKLTGMSKENIHKVRSHFKLNEITAHVVSQYEKKGFFYNLYGRPIKSANSPVNYWLQSSAADYSCLAFLNLIDRTGFKLRAVIHDAVLLEVSKSQLETIKKIKKIKDPISSICLNVEYSIIK